MKTTIRLSILGAVIGFTLGNIASGFILGIDRATIGERIYFQIMTLLTTWAVIEFNT